MSIYGIKKSSFLEKTYYCLKIDAINEKE